MPALAARFEFADEATNSFGHQIGKMYRAGYLKSFSVGFRPTAAPTPIIDEATGKLTGFEYRAMELLEISAVPIPAQPDARVRACADGILSVQEAARIFNVPSAANVELERELAELRGEVASLRDELRGIVEHDDPLDEFCAYLAPLL